MATIRLTLVLFVLCGCVAIVTGCDSGGDNGDVPPEEVPETIQDVVSGTAAYSDADRGFQEAGATTGLDDETAGPFTVIVPTNQAFTTIDADTLFDPSNAALLEDVMAYHVVPEAFSETGSTSTVRISSREGTEIRLQRSASGVTVNDVPATLVREVSNGFVYEIDAVLLRPLKLQERAEVSPGFSRLADAIEAAGLTSTLNGPGPFTLFAPSNSALADFTTDYASVPDRWEELLTYHVANGAFNATQLTDGLTIPTLEADGGALAVTRTGGDIQIDGVPLQTTDIQTENGVIHQIETPLTAALSLSEIISLRTDLSSLNGAIGGAGASSLPALADEDQALTFFAPSKTAFDRIDADELQADASVREELLSYHLLDDGVFLAADLESGSPTRITAEGEAIRIDASTGNLQINRAIVSQGDVRAANGVLHRLDGVLLETTRGVERITLTSRYRILQTALERVGLAATLQSGTYTIFAPPNDAWLAALDSDGSGSIEESEFPSNAALEDILLYHVVPGTIPSGNIDDGDTATTLEGSSITFEATAANAITINPSTDAAQVDPRDLRAENGVVHEIDTVLIP